MNTTTFKALWVYEGRSAIELANTLKCSRSHAYDLLNNPGKLTLDEITGIGRLLQVEPGKIVSVICGSKSIL